MIDTDKYEGHTPAPWDSLVCATTGKKWIIDGPEDSAWKTIALVEGIGENDVGWINMWLMADAPLLLAEVKRLREGIKEQMQFALDCVGSDVGDLYETIADDLRRLIE